MWNRVPETIPPSFLHEFTTDWLQGGIMRAANSHLRWLMSHLIRICIKIVIPDCYSPRECRRNHNILSCMSVHPVSHTELVDVDIIQLWRIFSTHWRTTPLHLAYIASGMFMWYQRGNVIFITKMNFLLYKFSKELRLFCNSHLARWSTVSPLLSK